MRVAQLYNLTEEDFRIKVLNFHRDLINGSANEHGFNHLRMRKDKIGT